MEFAGDTKPTIANRTFAATCSTGLATFPENTIANAAVLGYKQETVESVR